MVPTDASDSRLAALTRWVVSDLGFSGCRIEPASADASFRRYFRLTRETDTYIVMDAPPDKENSAPFVKVARMLAGMGLNVPIVLAQDLKQGFLLLSDLGSRQYLDELTAGRDVDRLYAQALAALVTMQTSGDAATSVAAASDAATSDAAPGDAATSVAAASGPAARELPRYDRDLLLREMELFPEWFLGRHLGLAVGAAERAVFDRLFEVLVRSAIAQPAAFVHRDYHSRNLLLTPQDNPGILDFQDAVWGPVTYDAVSLLKDCYIAWPAERVRGWLRDYRARLIAAGFAAGADAEEFQRWFDLMGLQRHIKVLGIFARLFYRDGKRGYLKDLPRVLEYARAAALAYPETVEFGEFLAAHVDAAFAVAQARVGVSAERPTRVSATGRPAAAMILAAGRGERMRPLTDTVPKPLLRVHGKPLIERHVERLARAGITRLVINLAWLGHLIRQYLGDGSRYGVAIDYSEEVPQALETAGGIFRALPRLGPGPFLVVNGDVLTDYPFERLRLGDADDAHLVLVPNPPQHPLGDFGLVAGRALAEAAERLTFSGIAVYRAAFFDGCADGVFPLKPLLLRAMTARRCAAELYTGRWEDVGTPERLHALNAGESGCGGSVS